MATCRSIHQTLEKQYNLPKLEGTEGVVLSAILYSTCCTQEMRLGDTIHSQVKLFVVSVCAVQGGHYGWQDTEIPPRQRMVDLCQELTEYLHYFLGNHESLDIICQNKTEQN